MTESADEPSKVDVHIHIGRAYEVMHEERRLATAQFAEELRASGLAAEVEVTEYVPGRRGLTPVEWTFIGIGTAKAVDLVVDGAKALLRRRREAKRATEGSPGRDLGFIIYGPDGEKLREWTTREEENVEN